MRIPYNWLAELVDIPWGPEGLAERLTLIGLEVETLTDFSPGASGIVAATVLSVSAHPSLDRLLVCRLSTGDKEYKVLTGWDGVRPGQTLAFAPPGSTLPGGRIIEPAEFAGEVSEGMLCSATEMMLGEPHQENEGVLELSTDLQPGTDLVSHFGLDDVVLELDLTPNYSHCLSMLGVATEVAALTGNEIRLPEPHVRESDLLCEESIAIKIEAPELCPRYAARMVRGVALGQSPVWLQARLLSAGMRPINNIVDITNYVMLLLGQPLHAFDYRRIAGKQIVVRSAGPDTRFTTLDGVVRVLSEDALVIADANTPVAIAGVMGGLDSEIEPGTSQVLIESALFNPVSVRKTATLLGLRSEASQRFERGIDPLIQGYAADLAASLMCELASGTADRGMVDENPIRYSPKSVLLRTKKVREILGLSIAEEDIKSCLTRLGFSLKDNRDSTFLVGVPSRRVDVSIEVDLIEEVGRLHGYDKVPSRLLERGAVGVNTPYQLGRRHIQQAMAGLGLQQTVTFSFISPKDFEKTGLGNPEECGALVLKNPMASEQSVMRQSMLPGLLSVVSYNVAHQNRDMGFFDLGKVFLPSENELPLEPHYLGVIVHGTPGGKWWRGGSAEADFYFAKGLLGALFGRLNQVVSKPQFEASSHPSFHPWRQARVSIEVADERHFVGHVGEIHPDVASAYGIEGRLAAFEIDCEPLLAGYPGRPVLKQIPRFPAVTRDIALVVEDGIDAAEVRTLLAELGGELLESVSLFDMYRGAPVRDGARSLAFTMVYRSHSHTLTDSEVDNHHERVRQQATESLGAMLR